MSDEPTRLNLPNPEGHEVLVDADLAPTIEQYSWRAQVSATGAVTFVRKYRDGTTVRTETLAQAVMGGKAPPGMKWQHIGDQYDYRRTNLRAVEVGRGTRERAAERATARPGGKFVGVQRAGNRWRARTVVDGQMRELGTYDTAEQAARAYDTAQRRRGLRPVNFPHETAPDEGT